MKGQISYAVGPIEAAFTFTLVMGVLYGAGNYTQTFYSQELIDVRADRVEHASNILKDYPAGSIELDITQYQYKVQESNFSMQIRDVNVTRNLSEHNFSEIEGPQDYESFNNFCLEKTFKQELIFKECGN